MSPPGTSQVLLWAASDKSKAKSLPAGLCPPFGPWGGTQVPPRETLGSLFTPPGTSSTVSSACARRSEAEQPLEGFYFHFQGRNVQGPGSSPGRVQALRLPQIPTQSSQWGREGRIQLWQRDLGSIPLETNPPWRWSWLRWALQTERGKIPSKLSEKNLSEITQISSKNASRPPKPTWECSDSLSWSGATSPHCTTSPGSCLPHQQLGRGRKLRAELWSSSSLKHVPLLGALPGAVGHGSHSSAWPGVYYFFFPLYCAESPLFPACLSPQG